MGIKALPLAHLQGAPSYGLYYDQSGSRSSRVDPYTSGVFNSVFGGRRFAMGEGTPSRA